MGATPERAAFVRFSPRTPAARLDQPLLDEITAN